MPGPPFWLMDVNDTPIGRPNHASPDFTPATDTE
jgi:hypothetical protein